MSPQVSRIEEAAFQALGLLATVALYQENMVIIPAIATALLLGLGTQALAQPNQWVAVPGSAGTRGWQQTSYDPATKTAITFGGSQETYKNDLFKTDLATGAVTRLRPFPDVPTPDHVAPCSRDGHNVVFVPQWNRHVVINGWHGGPITPGAGYTTCIPHVAAAAFDVATGTYERRNIQGMPHHPNRGAAMHPNGALYLYGGEFTGPSAEKVGRIDFYAQPDANGYWGKYTWLTPTGSRPPYAANAQNAFIWVPPLQKFLVMAGRGGGAWGAWLYDPTVGPGGQWTPMRPTAAGGVFPPYAEFAALAYEPVSGVVVFKPGKDAVTSQYVTGTWAWYPLENRWVDLVATQGMNALTAQSHTVLADGTGNLWILPASLGNSKYRMALKLGPPTSGASVPTPTPAPPPPSPPLVTPAPPIVRAGIASGATTPAAEPSPPAEGARVAAGGTATPGSSPGPPPSAAFKAKTWTVRPLYGKTGEAPGFGSHQKHSRPAYWPDGKLVVIFGGDHLGGPYPSSYKLASGRQEMYSYDVARNQWSVMQRYCREDGGLQPAGPDEFGWTWDSRRKVFWHLWGYQYNRTKPGEGYCPGNTTKHPLLFDPATRLWRTPDVPGATPDALVTVARPNFEGGSGVPNFAVYDAPNDAFYFVSAGGGGHEVARFNATTNTWNRYQVPAAIQALLKATWHDTMPTYDPVARQMYIIPPWVNRLIRFDIPTSKFEDLGPIPLVAPEIRPTEEAMPQWDTVSGVLLYPHTSPQTDDLAMTRKVTLFSYDPRTNQWAREPMPAGVTVKANNSVFDPDQNVLMLYGLDSTLFFYRYAERR